MTKKNILITLAILFVLIIVYCIKFTAINVAMANILFPKSFRNYHYLNEGAQSDNFKADYLFYDPANIDYDTETGFFIITTAHVNQAFLVYHKLDASGNLLDSLVSDTTAIHTFYAEGVVFGADYFINWSTSNNKDKQPFTAFLNQDFSMDDKTWEENFEANYKKATAVTYCPSPDWDYLTFYFKTGTGWTAMNTLKNDSRIFQDMASENKLDFKGFPARGKRFIALKDVITGQYPLLSYKHQSNDEKINYDWTNEKNPVVLKYFKKENLQGTAPYTGLPQTWGGDGYLELKHKKEVIPFKEIGLKKVGFFTKPEINLALYKVPPQYEAKCDLAFIILNYGTNIGDRGGNGLYVIRKK